jgi:hypothetical protein
LALAGGFVLGTGFGGDSDLTGCSFAAVDFTTAGFSINIAVIVRG